MAVNIGINGLGRIGRLVLRAIYENPGKYSGVKVKMINDAFGDSKIESKQFMRQVGLLTGFDSVHGRFLGVKHFEEVLEAIKVEGNILKVCNDEIKVLNQKEIPPWGSSGVDVVIESTGALKDFPKASKHLEAGAKRVIISAPPKAEKDEEDKKTPNLDRKVPTFVLGVNEGEYDPTRHRVISNASCTTNDLAPVAQVLLEGPGITQGWMTTVHAYTNDQNLVDAFHREEIRRARAGAMNIILTKTGAAEAVGLVIPALKGKLTGAASRVTTGNVSAVDLVFNPERPTTVDEVNELLEQASVGRLKGILAYVKEELVSSDFNHDDRSSIVDAKSTKVINGQLVRVLSWYDNEWGYANRLLDLALYMASQGL